MEDPNEPLTPQEQAMARMPDANSPTRLVIFYDRWFVRSAIAAFLMVLAVVLFSVKLWDTAPPGFPGKLKVSGLDFIQARALRHTAVKNYNVGDLPGSMIAWRSAIANTPGDPDLYRQMLQNLAEFPKARREFLSFGVQQGLVLLELTSTNVNDVELIASYLRRFQVFDWELALLETRTDSLSPKGVRLYAEGLFFSGRMEEYAKFWSGHDSILAADDASALTHVAWEAFWGPPAFIAEARKKLAAARKDPRLGILAAKLQLRVSASIPDLPGFRSALHQLEEAHEDQLLDAIAHWKLLHEMGRTTEAIKFAKDFATAPATPEETLHMAAVFDELGMTEYCADFLAKYASEFSYVPQIWVSRAQIAIKLKRWVELREIAITMRASPSLAKQLGGYSSYLEGISELRLNNKETAGQIFKRAAEGGFPSPELAFRAATDLIQFGYPDLATALLSKNEKSFPNQLEFWFQLTLAAADNKDTELLMRAAKRAYEIDPHNLSAINNYAAALLVNRADPNEAAKLTLQLVASNPDQRDYKINHALALIMNRRFDDAEHVLLRMDQSGLKNAEMSMIHYGWFQIFSERDQIHAASREAEQIEMRFLRGAQAKYVTDTLRRFGVN